MKAALSRTASPPSCLRPLAWAVVALACLTLAPVRADEPSLEVTANRNRLYLGESVVLNIKVAGADGRSEPDLSKLRHCRVKALGSQDISNYSIVIINGNMQRQGFSGRVFTYEITPDDEGAFVAGPVTMQVGGRSLTAEGPAVTVVGISKQDLVKISVSASRTTMLADEHQPFDITLRVRIKRLTGRYADTEPLYPANPPVLTVPFLEAHEIEGLKGPDVGQLLNSKLAGRNQPGLAINDYKVRNNIFDFGGFFNNQDPFAPRPAIFVLEKRPVTENGVAYIEYTITVSYSPLEEGTHTFGPVVFKGQVPVEVDANGQASGTEVFAVGPAVTVRVIPPPEENRPESYIGVLGSNLVARAALDAQTCNVGDPLTLSLTVEGPIQMRNVCPPRLSLQTNLLERFEVYDDSVKTTKRDTGRVYAYTLRPRRPGSIEVPPLAVSFYDVNTRGYRTVFTEPIPVKVRQATEVTASQIIGNVTGPVVRVSQTAREADLTVAGLRLDPLGAQPVQVWGSTPTVLATAAAGPALFLGVLLAASVLRRRDAWRQQRLARQARGCAERALRALATAPGPAAARHGLACAALRQYLCDRLALPAAALTPGEASDLLRRRGLDAGRAAAFEAIMSRHFNGEYETSGSTPPTAAEIETACRLIDEIDHELAALPKRPGASATRLLPLLVAAGLFTGVTAARAIAPDEADFIWNNANSLLASAHDPAGYVASAAEYQKLIDVGVRNPPLFYNQGTAFLQAGRYDDALRVLARAECYGGAQPDVTRNLQIARARKEGLKLRVMLWDRVLLFWHYRLPAATRILIAAAGFSLWWLGLALRVLRCPKPARRIMATALLVLIVFGTSAVTTLLQEQSAPRPIFPTAAP